MKRVIKFYFFLSLIIQQGCGQGQNAVISIFQSKNEITPDYFLFAPKELLILCSDSSGREKFLYSINRYVKKVELNNSERNEMKVLLTLIKNQVKALRVDQEQDNKTKQFIMDTLRPYEIDFTVSEAFVKERFSTDSDLTSCSACQSMYIFLVYDPLLYVKVRGNEKGFSEKRLHFPLAYTLQNCDIPIGIRTRMKEGLLQILGPRKDPLLIIISKEVEGCKLEVPCN